MRQVMSARWNSVTQEYLYALMSDKLRSRFVLLPILITVLLTLWGGTAGANERVVQVAAAADLRFALDEIIESFQRQHQDIKAQVTYGSSGNFFAQLSNRAPFDIYFSADVDYPRKLIEQGLAIKETEFLYAVGRIVVWAPRRSSLDLERLGIRALLDPAVRKIAIANPKHAPYGRAAEAAMRKLGVYEQVQERLVLGENIAQTAQFIETRGGRHRHHRSWARSGTGSAGRGTVLGGAAGRLPADGPRRRHPAVGQGHGCRPSVASFRARSRGQGHPATLRLFPSWK